MATVVICKVEELAHVLDEYQSVYANRDDRLIAVHAHRGIDPVEVAKMKAHYSERFPDSKDGPIMCPIVYEWRELYFEKR